MAAAEGSLRKRNVLCRYFVHGVCREGNNCHFSHDRQDQQNMVCKYFLKGNCCYGDRCRYDHVKPQIQNSPLVKSNSCQTPHKVPPPLSISSLESVGSGGMVNLKKRSKNSLCSIKAASPNGLNPSVEDWVKAAEFVPGQPYSGSAPPSYAKAAQNALENGKENVEWLPTNGEDISLSKKENLLCPFLAHGACPYEDQCAYLHGDCCEMCRLNVLHPTDVEERRRHEIECLKDHESDMEYSFAVAQSKDKVCGICMETVLDKQPPTEQRFGILLNCNHVFCLSCIRKWRSAKQFESKIIRSCPECRVQSDFVTPSKIWVESKQEKEKLIEEYKTALSMKNCKYFDQGRGECPFNEKCFYRHAYPDGRIAEPKPRRRRHRRNADGDVDILQQLMLWDFFEEREDILLSLDFADELDEFFQLFVSSTSDSDSDDDDDDYEDNLWNDFFS